MKNVAKINIWRTQLGRDSADPKVTRLGFFRVAFFTKSCAAGCYHRLTTAVLHPPFRSSYMLSTDHVTDVLAELSSSSLALLQSLFIADLSLAWNLAMPNISCTSKPGGLDWIPDAGFWMAESHHFICLTFFQCIETQYLATVAVVLLALCLTFCIAGQV